MKELTREQFIKDQNYRKQLVCYSIFAIAGIGITLFELSLIKTFDFNSMFQLFVIVLFVFLPFGIWLGVSKITATTLEIKKVNNGEFRIEEREVIDKTRVHADSSNRYCQIVFSETEGVWVSRTKDKEIKVGDICYLIYLSGSDYPCAIYSKRNTKLAPDMLLTT